MKDYLIYSIGFLSQILFFGRTIIQWFKSEHEGRVLSPTLFWKISLLASILMLTYGILRNDAAILIGQILVYFMSATSSSKTTGNRCPYSCAPVFC